MIKQNLILALCLSVFMFSSCSSDDDASGPIDVIIEGATIAPEVGGPNQPNQVYVDLSTKTTTVVRRDSWDLGFYSGSDFRVVLNGSIYMAAAKLTATDIDAVDATSTEVLELQPQVQVGTFDAISGTFIDAPEGNISGTAIAQISNTDSENHVYLVNLGDEVGTATPATGGAEVSGGERGWKKIRVLRNGEGYKLQYADLDATTHKEVEISKKDGFQFTFFSFNTNSVVNVEPTKSDWDLNFTVFTNIIPGYGAYGYADFVLNNSKSNVKAYMVSIEDEAALDYDNFTIADVEHSKFTNDQRSIGASWRNGGGPDTLPTLKEGVFYIVNDADGNLYKLKFLALTNESGVRGYPKFIYSLLK